MRSKVVLGSILGVIAMAIMVVVLIPNPDDKPRSSAGVELINDATVRITQDDMLILESEAGLLWQVTYDGADSVHFKGSADSDDGGIRYYTVYSLCGVDCLSEVQHSVVTFGGKPAPVKSIVLTERDNQRVDLKLSEGWVYRPAK